MTEKQKVINALNSTKTNFIDSEGTSSIGNWVQVPVQNEVDSLLILFDSEGNLQNISWTQGTSQGG